MSKWQERRLIRNKNIKKQSFTPQTRAQFSAKTLITKPSNIFSNKNRFSDLLQDAQTDLQASMNKQPDCLQDPEKRISIYTLLPTIFIILCVLLNLFLLFILKISVLYVILLIIICYIIHKKVKIGW